MDTRDLHEKGLKLRREIFGDEAVEQRTKAFGAFGEPLQNMINAYAYGDIWSRPALPLKTKSLAAIAMTAAIGRASELRVHLNGALTNGCTADEIRDVLLLVALYCGIRERGPSHRARRAARARRDLRQRCRVGKGALLGLSAWAKSHPRRSPSKTGVNALMVHAATTSEAILPTLPLRSRSIASGARSMLGCVH
jgi:4-carboxymuconolactone decarboxylase